ncbi:MAG: hypothetical protein IKD19_05810 [Prevotella sp.]|nr:hypothetical protein [Prevotella sp.]
MKKTLQAMLIALVAIMMPIGAWAEETLTHSLTIPSTGHTTLYLGFNAVIPAGITAYIVTEVSMSGGIKFKEIGGNRVIPANTGVVIEGNEGTYDFNSTSSDGEMPDNNLLEGTAYTKPLTDEGYVFYVLNIVEGMWKKATEIPANNAYLQLPASEYGNQASLCFSAHSFEDGVCSECKAVCTHPSIENDMCTTCEMAIEAKWGASKDALTGSGTLQDAFDAAYAENSTVRYIQLRNDINLDSGYIIWGGTFTLDLNGKELKSNSNTLDFRACTVTLTDNSDGGDGKVVSTDGDSYSIWLNNAEVANLTIKKGRYEGAGSDVISVEGGQLTINGGEFAAYEDASQTNIVNCSEAASLTITGGSFDAERSNYAISTHGTTTISGGTFTNSLSATIDYIGGSLQLKGNVAGMTVNYSSVDNRYINLPEGYNFYNTDDEQKGIEELEYDNIYTISKLFKISFAAGEGASGEMADVEDSAYYALPECGFTAPEGKMFDAWKVGDGETTYQPYERIMLTSDITLTALWTDYEPQIIIRMFDSYGDGWTGNAIVVKNSNEDEGSTYTIDGGRVSIIKIDYDKTKDYLFYWSYNEDESSPYECSFQILVDGEEVYSAADVYTEDATNYCTDFQDGQLVYDIMAPLTEKVINDGEVIEFEVLGDTKVGTLTYNRTLPNLTWNALYVPFEIPMTAMESYDVAYINDVHSYDKDGNGTIDAMDMEVIKIMSGTLNANYPYLIRAKNESAKSMNINLTDATLYKTEHDSVFCSSVFTEFKVYGTYEQKNQKDNQDILAIGGDGSWHKLAEGTTLNPFRLYLKIEDIEGSPVKVEESAASKIRIKVWGEDSDATGIEDNCELGVTSEELGVRSEEYYDLQGRRVKNPTKGLYIINGKKVNLP